MLKFACSSCAGRGFQPTEALTLDRCPACSGTGSRPLRPGAVVAFIGGEFVEAQHSLTDMLAVLEDIQAEEDDVAVWQDGRLLAVRLGNGAVIYPHGRPTRPAA